MESAGKGKVVSAFGTAVERLSPLNTTLLLTLSFVVPSSKNKNSETNDSGINIALNIATVTTRYLKFEKTSLKLFVNL